MSKERATGGLEKRSSNFKGVFQLVLWLKFITPISRHFRRSRARLMIKILGDDFPEKRVCDLGGSVHFWKNLDPALRPKDLVILNIGDDAQSRADDTQTDLNITLYDGRSIPFPDQHFDIVVCNSVIEHLPPEQRHSFVCEMRRVGRGYFVQTPAYEFPVEPHFVMPFIHWLPRPIGRALVPFSLWAILCKASKELQAKYFDEVRLLTVRELRTYFPDGNIVTERVLGLPKSRIVYQLLHSSADGRG
jgi:Methyltransferase domain